MKQKCMYGTGEVNYLCCIVGEKKMRVIDFLQLNPDDGEEV